MPGQPTERPSVSHRHRLALAAIFLLAVLHGLFWVSALIVWNPVDEMQHFGYVESLATGEGIPSIGRDLVSDEVLAIAKESPTYYFRSQLVKPTAADPAWGASSNQYEAVQGPLYYAAMVPAYWVGRALGGTLGALYAVRIATVLLAAAAVPLTWLLARELFPTRPAIWLLAAGMLAALNGVAANLGAATNDALILPLGALAAWSIVWARHLDRNRVAIAGGVLGIALLAKPTAIGLFPPIVVLVAGVAWRSRAEARRVLTSAAVFVAAAVAPLLPWFAWNFWAYRSLTGSGPADDLLGPLQPEFPRTLAGVREVLDTLRTGVWNSSLYAGSREPYTIWWERVLLVSVAIGLVAAIARRDRGAILRVGWLGSALPLAALSMVALVFGYYGGRGATPGRYLYPVLPLALVAIAACLVIALGNRLGVAAVLLVIVVSLGLERSFTDGYVRAAYGLQLFGDRLGVAAEQSWADESVATDRLTINTTCPAELIGLGVIGAPPAITVLGGDGTSVANGAWMLTDAGFSYYRLDRPVAGPLEVRLPAQQLVLASKARREPTGHIPGERSDPLLRVYCPVDDAVGLRFRQLYPPNHPSLSRGVLLGWSRWWAFAGVGVGAVGSLLALVGPDRIRPRKNGDARG